MSGSDFIHSFSFPQATTEPVNVIEPINIPIVVSIMSKLASSPCLWKKLENETIVAAIPTKL